MVRNVLEQPSMNVIFLSPAFPPTARHFCRALSERGVHVLGIGDEPYAAQRAEFANLADYVFEPNMADYEALRRAVASLRSRYGSIDRIDSNGEHWLEAEARLRDDFGVTGLQSAELRKHRSKLGMAETFRAAGVPHPPGVFVSSAGQVRAFAAEHGFPLVFKPDTGSGAVDTFSVADSRELEQALSRDLSRHVVQPFVTGDIVTYDGLTDGAGNIVFSASHVYDVGIMQLRQGRRDGYYYSERVIPPRLEEIGARAVAAFGLRERFFHLEFFARPDGSYVALEMNLRPPGGFSTDMMNQAGNIDVYSLWARALMGERLDSIVYERKYHTAHAGRRRERSYRLSHDDVARELGSALVAVEPIPAAFADTMGDTMYLLRHAELAALQAAIRLVHAQ
jgi:carbamoylphosphate synthase large subunit